MAQLEIVVVFDNKTLKPDLVPSWGFACVVRFNGRTMLFDTGSDGTILVDNLKNLNINPGDIEVVMLSHAHWDHAGGSEHILEVNSNLTVHLPQSFPKSHKERILNYGAQLKQIDSAEELSTGVFTTGEMKGLIEEQALVFKTSKGTVVITGCAHPGIVEVVQTAQEVSADNIYLVLGGFHFPKPKVVSSFRKLGVQKSAPCHCSGDEALDFFQEAYGDGYIEVGAGTEILIG